jgi:hypothetical protein
MKIASSLELPGDSRHFTFEGEGCVFSLIFYPETATQRTIIGTGVKVRTKIASDIHPIIFLLGSRGIAE